LTKTCSEFLLNNSKLVELHSNSSRGIKLKQNIKGMLSDVMYATF
jgi:hypothetical protein